MTRNRLYHIFIFTLLVSSVSIISPAWAAKPETKTEVEAEQGEEIEEIILPPAGTAPSTITVRVTGDHVPESVYLPLAEGFIRDKIRIQTEAQYQINISEVNYVDPPRAGGVGFFTVPVKIWGERYSTVRRDVVVRLENLSVEGFGDPERIYVSNSPESLEHSGELLADTLRHGTSSRFMIHHRNNTQRDLNFVFFISNPGDEPALVRVIGDILGVWNQEMIAGHDATENFMKSLRLGAGYLVEVPPGGYVTLKKFAFSPGQIVSGLCDVQVLRGQGMDFSVRVLEQYLPDHAPREEIGDFYSNRAHGHYGNPLITVENQYIVGERWQFLSVGHDGLPPLNPDSPPLHGNYGVTYDFSIAVENPGDKAEVVEIRFAPAGGAAMGTFFINDKFLQTKTVKPPDKELIHSMKLEPGATRNVRIRTIPESGSYYPVRLIVGSRIKGF